MCICLCIYVVFQVQILNKKVDLSKVTAKLGSKDNIKHKPGDYFGYSFFLLIFYPNYTGCMALATREHKVYGPRNQRHNGLSNQINNLNGLSN